MDHRRASAPQSSEGTPQLQAAGWQPEVASAYALYHGDRRRKPGLREHRRRPLRLKVQQFLAALLPILAVLAVFVACSRTLPASRFSGNAGRRLAAEGSEDEEEEQRAGIMNACLALEEEFGLAPLPLTIPQQATSQPLQFLLADSEQQRAGEDRDLVQRAPSPLPSPQEEVLQMLDFLLEDPQAEEERSSVQQAPLPLESPQERIPQRPDLLLADRQQHQVGEERDRVQQAPSPLPSPQEEVLQMLDFLLEDPQPQQSGEALGLFPKSPLLLATPQQPIPQRLRFPLPDPQQQQAEEESALVQQAPSLSRPQEDYSQISDLLFADPPQQAEEGRGLVQQAPFPLRSPPQKAILPNLDFLLDEPQQQEAGEEVVQQSPLPAKENAISQILDFLTDLPEQPALESQPPPGPQAQAPSSPLPAQPGSSREAPVQWESEGFTDEALGATGGAPEGTPEGPPRGALECLHSSDAAPAEQGDVPLLPAQPEAPEFVLGQKRSIEDPQTSTATIPVMLMKGEQAPGQSLSKEQTSGWTTGSLLQASRDLFLSPTPQEATANILEYLLADLPQGHAVESQPTAGPQAQAPSSALTASAFSPQPGPSHAALVQWGYEGFAAEHLAIREAAAPMQGNRSSFPAQHDVPEIISGHKRSISDPPANKGTIPIKSMKGVDASRPPPTKKCRGSPETSPDPSINTKGQPQQPAAGPPAEAGTSQLHFSQQHAEGQHLLAEEAVATSAASLSSPGPSTSSQGSAGLGSGSLQDALEGPSGSAQTPTPHPSDQSGANVQPEPRLPPAAPPMPPDTHVYYRLPVLHQGVQVPAFDGPEALLGPYATSNSHLHLLNVRSLLTQRTLNAAQATSLLRSATVLIRHLRYSHTTPVSGHVNKAVGVLGIRYIFLEALFCIVQVIGPPMNASQWWPELIKGIPSKYCPFRQSRFSTRGFVLEGIAERLSAALESLKNGIRPDMTETLWLKRALFGDAAVHKFKCEKWDLWRAADEDSEGAGSH